MKNYNDSLTAVDVYAARYPFETDGGVACAARAREIAVARSPVGIDIEKIDAERFDEKLQARILTPAERSALSRLAASERSLQANILWTEKEALFKRDNGKLFAANIILNI